MIDSKLKPWLIEINQSPSFATDSNLDHKIKYKLMVDTLSLLNLSAERKQSYLETKEKLYYDRIMNPYKQQRMSVIEKENKRIELDSLRNKEEETILKTAGFTLIFPVLYDEERMQVYSKLLNLAKSL